MIPSHSPSLSFSYHFPSSIMPPRKARASAAASTAGKKRARSEERDAGEAPPTKRGPGRPRKSVVDGAASTRPTATRKLEVLISTKKPSVSTRPTRGNTAVTAAGSRSRRALIGANGVLERDNKRSIMPMPMAGEPQEKWGKGKTLLVWGCGDSGEFGMGEGDDVKGEINRPRLHAW